MQPKKAIPTWLWLIIYTLVLMAPAFYNGYPLVYSDSGTYIQSGMQWELPIDRPLVYGLFIKITSLGFSLWNVIFFQCLIVAYTLLMTVRLVSNMHPKFYQQFLFGLIFLVAFSGLGWYSSQLMPDIFTAVAILALFLLLQYSKTALKHRIILSFILVFSITTHFSNLLIILVLFALLFALSKLGFVKYLLQFRLFLLLLLSCPISTSLLNYTVSGSFAVSKSAHVFLMGRLLDSGVLGSFLNDKCGQHDYILCPYKDSLPIDSRALLWDGNSPLAKQGGWEATAKPYRKIIFGVMTSPKHCFLWAYNSTTAAFSQCFQNTIGSDLVNDWYATPNSPPYRQIDKHFGHELNPYLQSRQNINLWKQGLDFRFLNQVYYLLLVLSVLLLIAGWSYPSYWGPLSTELKLLLLICILGIFFNAFFTAALANIYDRLQGRVSWLWMGMGGGMLMQAFFKAKK